MAQHSSTKRSTRSRTARSTTAHPAAPDPELYREQMETQNEELRQAQLLLEQSRDRYAALYDFAPVGYVTLDQYGTILQMNGACASLLNLDRSTVIRRPFRTLVVRSDLTSFNAHLRRVASGQTSVTTELQLQRRPNRVWYAQLISTPVFEAERNATVFWTAVADITERKRAEVERERLLDEVQSGREQLKALSAELLQAQETERHRLALELHDEIGQALTGLKLMLELCLRLPPAAVGAKLSEAKAVVDQLVMLEEELSLDLRPSMLDDLGLLPALLWHIDRFRRQTNIQVHLSHSLDAGQRFDPAVETAGYRIVQEALTNVARHAGVNEVSIMLQASDHALQITIHDHGVGFDPGSLAPNRQTAGLSGMRERATLLGGQLLIKSAPGTGTTILAELPCEVKTVEA